MRRDMMWWTLALALGCNGNPDTDKDTTGGDTEVPAGEPTWEVMADEIPGGVMLSAATLGGDMVIAGGDYGNSGTLWRYDGDSLCVEEDVAEVALWWIQGQSENDWWAVGEDALVIHSVDGTRTREDLPSVGLTLFGVYDDGTDVWTIGGYVGGDKDGTGEIWRKPAGGDWALVDTTPGLGFKVHEGWFVGNGFAWWWDGTQMVDRTPKGGPRLTTVRARSADDVWAVGGVVRAELWHWDGTAWTAPEQDGTCLSSALNGVYTEPGEPVWLTGNNGVATSLEDGDSSWDCTDFPITAKAFHAVWRWEDEALMVGGNLLSTGEKHGTLARYAPAGRAFEVEGACE